MRSSISRSAAYTATESESVDDSISIQWRHSAHTVLVKPVAVVK